MKYIIRYLLILTFINVGNLYAQGEQKDRILLNADLKRYQKEKAIDVKVYDLMGKEFPAFVLSDLNGYALNSASLKGKPTVINLWNIDCQACLNAMKPLDIVKKSHLGDANFISITEHSQQELFEFLAVRSFDFTHILAPRSYLQNFGLTMYPKTFILDKDFRVVEILSEIQFNGENFKEKQSQFADNISACLEELKN